MSALDRTAPGHPAVVALEDGLVLEARAVGALGTALGEMAFTTGMSGYQEAVTDPSYLGQILCFAAPMIGNYGTGGTCVESRAPWPAAVVMRAAGNGPGAAGPEGWCDWLARHGVIAVDEVDTRTLVTRLREVGGIRGGVSTELDPAALCDRIRAHPVLDGRDISAAASRGRWSAGDEGPLVAAIDCGMKQGISARLVAAGCRIEALPPTATAADVRALRPDGFLLSNGPGDPGAVTTVVETTRALLGELPVFGICMGHQLIGRALGMATERLPFGHRGANHPVRRESDGRVLVTVQNHGFAVTESRGLPSGVEITHRSLFDGSIEGIAHDGLGVSCVQFHPEARPGPRDAVDLFDSFAEVLRAA